MRVPISRSHTPPACQQTLPSRNKGARPHSPLETRGAARESLERQVPLPGPGSHFTTHTNSLFNVLDSSCQLHLASSYYLACHDYAFARGTSGSSFERQRSLSPKDLRASATWHLTVIRRGSVLFYMHRNSIQRRESMVAG